MKKNIAKLLAAILFFTAAVGFLQPLKVFAASGNVTFTAEKDEVEVGEVFTMYLTVEADREIGEFECYIYYDETKLEFRNGSDSVQGDDGVLKVSVVNGLSATDTKRIVMKFVALAPTNCVFQVSNAKLYDLSGAPMSLMAYEAVVKINPKPTASSDNSLTNIRISAGTLSPAFSPDITEYRTEVSKDVNALYVTAERNDEKARVNISGNSPLYPGENTVHIIVTAENGAIREYVITVVKTENAAATPTPKPTATPTPTSAPSPTPSELIWHMDVYDKDGKIFIGGTFNFEVIENAEGITVPAGYNKTKLMISGHNVPVYSPGTSDDTDFVLMILSRDGMAPALYRYDRAEKTIQRFVKEDITIHRDDKADTVSSETLEKLEAQKTTISRLGLVIAALVSLLLMSLIALIYMIKKAKGYDDLDEE